MGLPLPQKFSWLNNEGAPRQLVEAIKHYGILEKPGAGSEQAILNWATEVGVRGWYPNDAVPWCGLFVGVVMKRAGYAVRTDLLSALSWATWGEGIPKGREALWDILVFTRTGGGHVGFYVGETSTLYLVFGGNQSDAVGFAWIAKSRIHAIRRPVYQIGEPPNVRKIWLTDAGEPSTNEQ